MTTSHFEEDISPEDLACSNEFYDDLMSQNLAYQQFESMHCQKHNTSPTEKVINSAMAKYACTDAKLKDLI